MRGRLRPVPAGLRAGAWQAEPAPAAARRDEQRQREPASERGRRRLREQGGRRQREPQQHGVTVAAAAHGHCSSAYEPPSAAGFARLARE